MICPSSNGFTLWNALYQCIAAAAFDGAAMLNIVQISRFRDAVGVLPTDPLLEHRATCSTLARKLFLAERHSYVSQAQRMRE